MRSLFFLFNSIIRDSFYHKRCMGEIESGSVGGLPPTS